MAYIRHIETLVPEFRYSQEALRDRMTERAGNVRTRRLIHKAYGESGIHTRHSVLPDFMESPAEPKLYRNPDGTGKRDSSTGARNAIYVEAARRLLPEIARRTMARPHGISASEITHVITVSCTGFFNPGPDLLLVETLGLPSSVQRYQLGFMGCYAAIPALRMADQFCRADPSAAVLIVCLEWCTLHMQDSDDMDAVVANSVFADGMAAALVSAKAPAAGSRAFSISHFASTLAREGVSDMAWDIGDTGFNIILSKYVSRIIGAGINGIIEEAFSRSGATPAEITHWAVHPGGRAILDKVESSLGLLPGQIEASRSTLSRFGNMSSATILFVLSQILKDPATENRDRICAMAFGPGLTIETSLLHAVVA